MRYRILLATGTLVAVAVIAAVVLAVDDLRALASTLIAIANGSAVSTGFYARIFPVRGPIQFATGFAWNNR